MILRGSSSRIAVAFLAVVSAAVVAGCTPDAPELASLQVGAPTSMEGYDRAFFGQAWSDDVTVPYGHNGCDTRNDILRRDLDDVVVKDGTFGCKVLRGTLNDPYTGRQIPFTRSAIQIDHVVALGDAWETGAQQWDSQTRQNFANDPDNLLAVEADANQDKGAANAARWLPPNAAFHCEYVRRQIAVKKKYSLIVTLKEKEAMQAVLSECDEAPAAEKLS